MSSAIDLPGRVPGGDPYARGPVLPPEKCLGCGQAATLPSGFCSPECERRSAYEAAVAAMQRFGFGTFAERDWPRGSFDQAVRRATLAIADLDREGVRAQLVRLAEIALAYDGDLRLFVFRGKADLHLSVSRPLTADEAAQLDEKAEVAP